MTSLPHEQKGSPLELPMIGIALLVLIFIQLISTKTLGLFTQPLWLDECLTQVLANDPSFTHEMAALKHGVDTTPPTFYLILKFLHAFCGTLGPVQLRMISLFAVVVALVGVYAIARRAFDRFSAIVAVLMVLSHQAIVEEMFQARHYGLWIAAIVWFAYFQLDANSRRHLILAAIFAALTTTMHWLGIIAVACIAGVDLLMHRSIKRMIPALVGVLALCASYPFLHGQRQNLNPPTWIEAMTMSDIRDVLRHLFAGAPVIVVLLTYWVCRVICASRDDRQRDVRVLAPVSALLAFPFILIVLSKLMQPMLMIRYVTPAIIPLALLCAELSSRAGKAARIGVIAALIVLSTVEFRNLGAVGRISSDRVAGHASAIEEIVQQHAAQPVVVMRRLELFPIIHAHPELAPHLAQLRFDRPMPFELKLRTRYEEVMCARVHEYYPQFQQMDYSNVLAMKRFYVINPPNDADEDLHRVFPGAKIEQRGEDLYEITRP